MSVRIYGIKNCDTMKKALGWLDGQHIAYIFHDYKKSGVDLALLEKAIHQHGWENVLNRKGTSWRALPESVKVSMDAARALQVAQDNPSLIRRPLLVFKENIHLGFDEKNYASILRK